MIVKIAKEQGLPWLVCRGLYSAKLALLKRVPAAEGLFEHSVRISRTELLPDNTGQIEKFLKNLPEQEKHRLLQEADGACCGRIRGFSSVDMDYGMPINWQLSPLTGKACDPAVKWYRIPDFDKERGDIKAVWEISRFSHFITLARAFLVSGERKYFDAFRAQLAAWLKDNPYSYGANYKCGQECALRMMNGLLAYNVFRTKGLTDDTDRRNVEELVSRCYRKILSNFFYAYRCIKNNHTISELAGMIVGAWCAGDTPRLKKAYRLLDEVIAEQFSPDGGYTQFAFNYQRFALQILEYVLYISANTGVSLSKASLERIKSSVLLLYQCQDASGDLPNYGSNDGALVFPVSAAGYRDFRPVLGSLYGMLFGKRLYEPGVYDEEAAWFCPAAEDLPPGEEIRQAAQFPEAGLVTLRREDSWLMAVANAYKSRPAHMDQLHLDLWVDGVNVLCDCGTYSYADPRGQALALTGAHNTVKLPDTEQMDRKGPFLIYNRTQRQDFLLTPTEFAGQIRSAKGYTHRREIRLCPEGYTVCDRVTAAQGKEFEILFHTPCQVRREGGQLRLYDRGRHLLTLECPLECQLREGVRSLHYLALEPVTRICFKGCLQDGTGQSLIKILVTNTEEAVQC